MLLFEEKQDIQWRRLNTRKMAISRRELSKHGNLLTRRTVKNISKEKEETLEKDKEQGD